MTNESRKNKPQKRRNKRVTNSSTFGFTLATVSRVFYLTACVSSPAAASSKNHSIVSVLTNAPGSVDFAFYKSSNHKSLSVNNPSICERTCILVSLVPQIPSVHTSRTSFTTDAFPAPVHTNMAVFAALSTGYVNVTRVGGGFGESVIGATRRSFSCN